MNGYQEVPGSPGFLFYPDFVIRYIFDQQGMVTDLKAIFEQAFESIYNMNIAASGIYNKN